MSGMSTRIEDLPGPAAEDILPDVELPPNLPGGLPTVERVESPLAVRDINTNVEVSVHKKKDEAGWSIGNEVNEENALLIALFIAASMQHVDGVLGRVPYLPKTGVGVHITKGILFAAVFVLAKRYILPKVKL